MGERWRTERKVGRTLYVHTGNDEEGRLIGVMDTAELAQIVCDAVNGGYARWRAEAGRLKFDLARAKDLERELRRIIDAVERSRDLAIRERDAARAEAEKLRGGS